MYRIYHNQPDVQYGCFDKLYCTTYRIYRIQPDDGRSSIGRNIALAEACSLDTIFSETVHHQEFKTVHSATGICETVIAVYLLASKQTAVSGCCMYSLELLHEDEGICQAGSS